MYEGIFDTPSLLLILPHRDQTPIGIAEESSMAFRGREHAIYSDGFCVRDTIWRG